MDDLTGVDPPIITAQALSTGFQDPISRGGAVEIDPESGG